MSANGGLRIVTGAGGFIGGALMRRWGGAGLRVVGTDFRAPYMHPETLLDWLRSSKSLPIECIVHLGACTDTREQDRGLLKRLNSDYSIALWELCTKHQIPLFYASSAATYGDGSRGYGDEEDRVASLRPLNPYGDSKQQFDLYALDRDRMGLAPPAWAGFKFFNVFGFDERLKGPMASVVHQSYFQIRETSKLKLFKSARDDFAHGHQMRDFVYVGDVLSMIDFCVKRATRTGIVNIGSGSARTFLDLAHAAFDALGQVRQIEFIEMPESIRDHYQYKTEAPLTKLRSLGFQVPTTSLEEGVNATLAALALLDPKPDHQGNVGNDAKDSSGSSTAELPLQT